MNSVGRAFLLAFFAILALVVIGQSGWSFWEILLALVLFSGLALVPLAILWHPGDARDADERRDA